MSTPLARLKTGYTQGGRDLGMAFMGRLGSLPFTPNQITVAGLAMNFAAAVLVVERHFVWATVVFITGSILDILDGALARTHGKLTPFGGFLDSTTDRLSEGLILGAIAIVLSEQGHQVALGCVFVALVGSFLVSYTRAKAESLGTAGRGGAHGTGRAGRARGGGAAVRRARIAAVRHLRARGAHHAHRHPAHRVRQTTTSLGGIGMADQASTNGHKKPTGKVRVAIVGAGNCASALVQGVHHYHDAKPDEFVPGLMHVDLGGYHISDIEFTAAFDVDADKVGRDLGEAIFRGQNNTVKFAEVPKLNVPVHRGMTHDGIGKYLSKVIEKAPGETADVVRILQETGTDVVVSYLPVGSEEATKWYVEQVLSAGCAFVNCVPVFIAREPYWQRRFEEKGLPIVGDDIKSQVGATIVHRQLTRLFRERGVKLERTHQLNVGGNTDFMNMLERERLESKKISKTNAVTSQLDYDIGARNVHIGPSDYVEWLDDRKWAYIRMEGRAFGDVPLNIELKLEVIDSPNSAGIVIDAVRCAKLALDNGIAGALEWPSAYFMKSPPVQHADDQCRDEVERFIASHTRTADGAKERTKAKA